jgi:amino acid adenylation domain-containing protein
VKHPLDQQLPDPRDARKVLLDRILQRKLNVESHRSPRLDGRSRLPLSPRQAQLWFLDQLHPNTAQYNIGSSINFSRWFEPADVERAVSTLMSRHDALRLRIIEDGADPFQEECKNPPLPIRFFDLRDMEISAAATQSEQVAAADARAAFRLGEAPLFRVSVVLLPAGHTLIVVVLHHIIADGWSLNLFWTGLANALAGNDLGPFPGSYLDYLYWLSDTENVAVLTAGLDYWRGKLGGALPVLDLPTDRSRPVLPTVRGSLLRFTIPTATMTSVKQLAEEEGTTLFMLLLAAYKVLLLRLTGETDVIVGVPFSGRNHPAAEQLIGFFVNTMALRTNLAGDPTYRAVVRRVSTTALEAQDHQAVPFERIVEELRTPRDMKYHPVFQTLFALHNTPSLGLPGADILMRQTELDTATAKFDLSLSLTERGSAITGTAEYMSDLFDENTVCRYIDCYLVLLQSLVARPDTPVRRHALLSVADKRHVLFDFNPPVKTGPQSHTLFEPFEQQARRTPNSPALVWEEGSLTYLELEKAATRLAKYLVYNGVGAGDFVGVCMERSVAIVVALYAVAKIGAAYVPLDLELPSERHLFMLRDSGARVVLTHALSYAAVPPGSWKTINTDEIALNWTASPDVSFPDPSPPHSPAYLLYTSGSTGRPKGVVYPAGASVRFLLWMRERYPIGTDDVVLLKTPVGFDVSVWELFWPLYAGAKLFLLRPGGHRDTQCLVDTIQRHRVTVVNFVPSMLQAFLEEKDLEGCDSLRWVLSAGEPLTPRLRDDFHTRLTATLVNLYGPTECGAVCDHIFDRNDVSPTIPIGRPAAEFRLHILDDDLEPSPIGVPGELYVGGSIGLANGYHNGPELTAQRFVPDPYSKYPGARLYRSGDLCRYLPDGSITYVGRRDRQLKLRGYRVEPAEIEAILCEHESIAASVVLILGEHDQKQIVAFVVPRAGSTFVAHEIIKYAEQRLPHFMVPAAILEIDQNPTTVNGKTDNASLLQHWQRAKLKNYREQVGDANEIEAQLGDLFARILGVPGVAVTDNFFRLGGHSLLVLKLASACERIFGWRPSIAQIFAAPTVRELALLMVHPSPKIGSYVVPLAPHSDKPVLLLVHAASGSVFPYRDLARNLSDEISVYGLQAPGLDDETKPPASIEEFAAHHLAVAAEFARHASVFVAGWSFGGNVAVEIARALLEMDVPVEGVILIDSWVNSGETLKANREVRKETLEALRVLRTTGLVPEDMPAAALRRLVRILEATMVAFWNSTPRWYESRVDLLRATEPLPAGLGESLVSYAAVDRGWGEFVREIVVHPVPGHHFNLMTSEIAPAIARTIRSIVADRVAQRGGCSPTATSSSAISAGP